MWESNWKKSKINNFSEISFPRNSVLFILNQSFDFIMFSVLGDYLRGTRSEL